MQLSPNEAIVMVSGVHPVRASKVRYYEDTQLKRRVLNPSRANPVAWSRRQTIGQAVRKSRPLPNSSRR